MGKNLRYFVTNLLYSMLLLATIFLLIYFISFTASYITSFLRFSDGLPYTIYSTELFDVVKIKVDSCKEALNLIVA